MDMIVRKWDPGHRRDCKGCSIFLDFSELWILPLVGNYVCLHQALDKITFGLEWSLGECWGCGALGKQTSPEWCSWPLFTGEQHIFHTITVNPAWLSVYTVTLLYGYVVAFTYCFSCSHVAWSSQGRTTYPPWEWIQTLRCVREVFCGACNGDQS